MKKSKLALLLGTLLSLFVLAGCPSPAGSGGDTVTVTFNDNGNVTKTVTLASGSSLSSLSSNQLPNNPSKLYNYFMYWSESKASQAAAVKFDYNKEITSNITLYAIYTPELSHSNAISKLTDSTIEIQLWDPKVYPLEDGSYAGLQILYSTDGYEYQDFGLTIPSAYKDSSFRYLTYTFSNTLSNGKYYFKVTNGYETGTKEITVTSNFQDPKTVTFDDNGSKRTITIESGSKVSKPSNPSKSGNTFLYWSNSKTSLAEVAEFDFNTAITDDITLYAIYTPTFYNTITSLSPTTVEIQLYGSTLYPLEDGSFAGIKALHSTNNKDYENYPINDVPNTDRAGYLKYTFTTPLSVGDHYIKVTNGIKETYEKTVSVIEPAPVSNLIADTDDSYVKVSFTTVKGYDSYTVQVFKGSSEIASKTISSYTTPSSRNVEFYGLDNGTEYTFRVLTDGTDKSAEITATPAIIQKETDWLFVMYLDGDNDLNDPIYLDLNEAERGLYENTNRNNIKVVALWDGWDFKSGNDDNETSFFDKAPTTYNIDTEATLLLELGADSNTLYDDENIYWKACELSSNTKNLSYTAPWIVPNRTVSTTTPKSNGEVNMGDVQTLTNYLNWVNAHYKANKGIILQFSNHGGGPRSVALKNSYGRRSMCWDETSGGVGFLKTSDVSKALYEAGFGTSNKVKMIMEDVCLGGSLEEAYELMDYAEYYIGSPNNIPANGFDYIAFVSSLTSTATIEEIGGKLVKSYKDYYTWSNEDWKKFLTNNQGLNNSNVTEIQKSVYNRSLSTLSFIDLSKIEAVKIAVKDYATLVNNATQAPADEIIKKGSDGNYYLKGNNDTYYKNGNLSEPASDSVTLTAISQKETVKYWTALAGDPLYYEGTFGSLKDLGYMSFTLYSIYHSNETTDWSPILAKSDAITAALNDAIIACWRDGYGAPTYYKNTQDSANSGLDDSWYGNNMGLGLTINCSCWIPDEGPDGNTYLFERFADWYSDELAFGKDCSAWTNLIKDWFNKK
jgi:hypothetical protein